MSTHSLIRRTCLWIIPVVGLMMFAACDTSLSTEGGSSATIEGSATDDSGYGKRAASIEGATVTAANIQSDGRLQTLSASTTTNASGEYTLEISDPSPVVLVKAEKDDYSSSALVYVEGNETGNIQAQPINSETRAEANVYVNAKSDGDEAATIADVAVFVDRQLAAQIESGATSSSDVAAALSTSFETEAAFLEESSDAGDGAVEQVSQTKAEAFADLQTNLASAAEASGEAEIIAEFQQTVHDAYLSADIPAEIYAKARQSAHAAIIMETEDVETSSDAQFSLRQQSEIATAAAVAQSIEASFQAQNASQSRLTTLGEARSQLITDLREATTVETMAQAKADYEDTVESELAAELDVDTTVISSAQEALSDIKATLESSLSLSISVSAAAEAHRTFYTNAESTAASSLDTSGKAQMGGQILAMLSLY